MGKKLPKIHISSIISLEGGMTMSRCIDTNLQRLGLRGKEFRTMRLALEGILRKNDAIVVNPGGVTNRNSNGGRK